METLGLMRVSALEFLVQIRSRLTDTTIDLRETTFLSRHPTIQRGICG